MRSKHVCKTWSRRTELNAFIMSSFTMTLWSFESILLVMNVRTAWTAASAPPFTEYIRRFLTSTATATLVSAFVLSRIDYCNSLLFGSTLDVTSHLQRIQNYAARVILRLPMSSRITIHLKSLHWLPVKVRSTYKIACLCYHCHSSTAPSYVTDMLYKKPLHTRNTRSSSYTMPLLNRPAHSKATLGDRSISFASSSVWNSIPNDVKCAPSLSSFKSRLKTYLFHSVYKD